MGHAVCFLALHQQRIWPTMPSVAMGDTTSPSRGGRGNHWSHEAPVEYTNLFAPQSCGRRSSRLSLVMPFTGQCRRRAMAKALLAFACGLACLGFASSVRAADIDEGRQLFIK